MFAQLPFKHMQQKQVIMVTILVSQTKDQNPTWTPSVLSNCIVCIVLWKVPVLFLIVCANKVRHGQQNLTRMDISRNVPDGFLEVWPVGQKQQHHVGLARSTQTQAPSQINWVRIYSLTRSPDDSQAHYSQKSALGASLLSQAASC